MARNYTGTSNKAQNPLNNTVANDQPQYTIPSSPKVSNEQPQYTIPPSPTVSKPTTRTTPKSPLVIQSVEDIPGVKKSSTPVPVPNPQQPGGASFYGGNKANTSGGAFSTVSNYLNTYTAPSLVTTEELEASKSGRQITPFAPNSMGWLGTAGTTGLSRNTAPGEKYTFFEITSEDNGLLFNTDGIFPWYDDNQARLNAVTTFALDNSTWRTADEMNSYAQEAANLYYDYGTMADEFKTRIDEIEAEFTKMQWPDDESKAWADDYLTQWRSNLEMVKQMQAQAKDVYDTLAFQNSEYGKYDDDKKYDIDDAKYYKDAQYGGDTPENLMAQWNDLNRQYYDTFDSYYELGAWAPSDDVGARQSISYQLEQVHNNILLANARKQELEKYNTQLTIARDYLGLNTGDPDKTRENYKAEEARLLRITLDGGVDGGTGRMRTQDEDDRLQYIQEVLGFDDRDRLEKQWQNATDEEIAARIEEITKGDKKTKSSDFNGADIVWGNIKLEGDKTDGFYVPDARSGGLLDQRDTTTVQIGGKYVVIPLVVNDGKGWRKLTQEEAIQRYQTKDEFFGIFTSPEQAAEYAAELKNEKPEGSEEPFWVSQLPKEREYTPDEMMELTVLNLIQMARAGDEYQKLYDEYISKSGEAAGTKAWLDHAYDKYARLKALYEAPQTGEDSGYTYAENIFNQAKKMETDKWTAEQRTAHWEDLKSKLVDDYDVPQELVDALDASGVKNLDEAISYIQGHAGAKNEKVAEEYQRAMQEYAWAQQYYEANLRNQKGYMDGLTKGMLMVNGMSNSYTGNKGLEALRDIVGFSRKYDYNELADFGLNISREDYEAFRDMIPHWTDPSVFTPYTEEDALKNPRVPKIDGIAVEPWTQEQVDNYYYILDTEGLTAATKYAIGINSDLNSEYKNKMKERWAIIQKYEAERVPGSFYFGAAIEPWLTALPSAFASVGDFVVMADQMATFGSPITSANFTVNEWNEFSQGVTANQLAASLQSNFGLSPALTTFLYNTYGSIAQSTEIMATGIGFARALGAIGAIPVGEVSLFGKSIDLAQHAASLVSDVTFFSGAATSTFRSLLEENPGIDPQKAWNAAVWAGVSEAAFEHISFDRLYDMVAKDAAAWSSWKDAFIHTMVSAGIEGSEELFTEFSNALGEALTIGENSKFNKKVAYFRGMGISKESAERYALQETLKELGLAFAGGALSGFVTTGATSTVGHVQAGAYNTELGTRLNAVMDKSSNQSAGALFADYLNNALYTTEDMSYTQRQEIDTLRGLAKKVQEGKASTEEVGRMVALADSYDSKLVNDFVLTNSSLWAAIQPVRVAAAFQEASERLLGVEEAHAYMEAKLKNPDAHVMNELEKMLIDATGKAADDERILNAESMLLNIVMGSDILKDGSTVLRMGMDIADGADLIAEAVESGSLSGEDIQRAVLSFFSNKQQRLQSAQNQGLRDMLAQGQEAADTMAGALTSQMEVPTVTAEMTADQVKAATKDFLTKLWTRSNEAANDLLKQTKNFLSKYQQDTKTLTEDQQKTTTIAKGVPDQGIADNRSGDDKVTINGKTVTRDAYISAMKNGRDPFNNNASTTPLAEEEAQIRFDQMIYQASSMAIPKAGMSAEMTKYDPKNKISKVESKVDTAKANESTQTAEAAKEETTTGPNPNIGAKEQTMGDKAAGGTTEGPLPENQEAYNKVVNAINATINKLKNLKEDAVTRFKTAIQKTKGHQVTPVYGEKNTAYELEIGGKILHFEYKKGNKATTPYVFIKNEDGSCVDILHNTAQGDDRAKSYSSVADMVADNSHSDNGVTPAAEVLEALKNYSQNIYNTLREAWEAEEKRLTDKLAEKREEEAKLKAPEKTEEEKSDVIITEPPAEKPQLPETTEEKKPAEKGPKPIPTATEAEKILAEDKAAGSKEETGASEQTAETTQAQEEELPPTDEEIDRQIAAANKTADQIMDEEEAPAEPPRSYTPEEVRGMDILATEDRAVSRGEGRSWKDSYTIFDPKTDGKRTITRAEYVASLMSGIEPSTGRALSAPLSLAQALDLFDTDATLEMEYQFVNENTSPAFSLTLDQIDRDLAELRRMKTWIAGLETKEKGTTNPVTLNKIRGHLMDAYKWFENAVGKVLNDRSLTLTNARQKINDELSSLKNQLKSISDRRRSGGPTSSLMQAEAVINKRVQALNNALKTLDNAEHFFNKYSGELETIRQKMYATDYANYAGGENNGQSTSGSNPSGRVSDMGDTGSGVESSGDDSGTAQGSQRAKRPGERAITGSSEEVLREVGATLDGKVVFDSLGKTEKDVQDDENLSPAVKAKILKAMRSGVARIIFTKGTLTQDGNAIHGFRDTVGNTKSLIIINDDSQFYQYLMNDKGTLYNYAVAKQLDHEFVHHMLALMGDGVRHNFMRTVLEAAFGGHREIYQEVFASYLADYGIAYNFKKNGKDYVLSREDAEKIEEEIISDIYAGFNRLDGDTELSTLFDRYLNGMQSAVKMIFESTGLEKYSSDLWKGTPHAIENILDASLFSSEIGRNVFNIDYSSLGQVTNLGSGRNSIESITAGANLAAVYEVEDQTGKKELTTFGEWLEQYLDKHPNETKDDAKVAFRKLERTGKAFVRGLAQLDADNKPVYDKDNFQTYEVKGEDVVNTPLGRLITYARDVSKTITADEAKQEYEFVAGVLNLLNKYQDSKMIWEVTGTEQWAAIKNNSDPQYRWTIDFSTICKKTQAIIDAISGVMTDLGSGLSKEEIKYVYLVTGFMGESTPCPVCYVFSRWMGLGGVLDNIWKFQQQYGKAVDPDGAKVMKLAKDVQELAEKESKSLTFGKQLAAAQNRQLGLLGDAIWSFGVYDSANEEIAKLQEAIEKAEAALRKNPDANKAENLRKQIEKKQNELKKYQEVLSHDKGFYSQQITDLSEIVDKFDVYKWAVRTRLVNADLLVKDVMKIEKKLVKMGATGETTEEIITSAQEVRDRLELSGKSTKEIDDLLEDLEDDTAALSSVDPARVAGIKSILAHKSSLSALKGVVTKAKKSGQGNVEAAEAKYNEAKLALDTEIAEFGAKEYTIRQEYKDIEDKSELFTLDSHVFAQKYPDIWGYRTSRGAGLGKAITPYADARVFEIIQGVASGSASGVKTGDRNPIFRKDGDADVQKILNRAIQNMAVQNLIGGMRFQSTSDFRYEYASDYLMALFEMQAMGANVQLYTKVVEAVDFFANAGCDVNLSVMPKNKGIGLLEAEPADWNERYSQYFTFENGKYKKVGNLESVPQWEAGKYYEILYSDVTGVNGAAARHFAQKYDNVQLIMVGINNNHINACLDSDDITFVIPFHGSGNKTADIQQMMRLLGEDIAVEEVTDFGAFESDVSDTTIKDPNDDRLQRRSLREEIVSGKMLDEDGNRRELTQQEQILLKNHPLLRDLYKRFYVDAPGADGKLNIVTEFQDADLQNIFEGMDHDEFKKKYYLNGVNECYGHFLSGDTAKKIFPYEYWDKSLTQSEAKANGDAFQQYCKDLGLIPRFTGFNSKNSYKADGDFSKNPNYWKLLIDRKMYDNRGNYRAQQKISLSKFGMSDEADYDFSTLNPGYGDIIFGDNGVLSNEVNPKTDEMRAKEKSNAIMSKSNNRAATEKIVKEAKQHIENARAESAKKNKEGQRPPENAFAMDEDVWKAYEDDHPDLAAKMIESGVMKPAAGVRLERDENGKPRLVVDKVKPTGEYSLAKDNASALTAEVKDYFKRIPRANNFYLSAKEIEDMMEVNPYGDQDMDNAEQIVMNLSELSKLQSGDDQVRTWELMEKVLPYLSVYAQGNWIEDRWSQNPDFTNWYNEKHPSLYYPGYEPGKMQIGLELNYLRQQLQREDLPDSDRESMQELYSQIANHPGRRMYSIDKTNTFDSTGRELSPEQVEYFKNSKVRDLLGNLIKLYHGTKAWGFTVFDPRFSDDNISFFLTDNQQVAQSYSGASGERSIAKGMQPEKPDYASLPDNELADLYNKEAGEWHTLVPVDPDNTSEILQKINEKFEYTVDHAINEIRTLRDSSLLEDTEKRSQLNFLLGRLSGYNIENLTLYDTIATELTDDFLNSYYFFTDEQTDDYWNLEYEDPERFEYDAFERTAERLGHDLQNIEYLQAITESINGGAETFALFDDSNAFIKAFTKDDVVTSVEQLNGYDTEKSGNYPFYANLENPLIIDADGAVWNDIPFEGKHFNTRTISEMAYDRGYDGVIFQNLVDIGGEDYDQVGATPSTVVIAFKSEQVKDAYNDNPTSDPDFRYSLANTYQDYEDAFWGDDPEWMRECVEAAARANGYTKKAYHGTMKYGFNEFWNVSRRELGVHVGTEAAANVFYDRALAMGQKAGVYEVFVKMENTLRTPDIWGTYTGLMDLVEGVDEWIKYGYDRGGDNIDTKWTRADSEKLKKILVKNQDYTRYLTAVYQARNAAMDYKSGKISLKVKENAMRNANLAAQMYLRNLGYDSVRYINEAEDAGSESYIILKPENIKSADTVTYGPDGNHVPLVERFNDSTRDIRYSVVHQVVDTNGKVYDDVLRMEYPADAVLYNDRGQFHTYVLNNLAGKTVGFVDKYGRLEKITFARDNDYATKHNNTHPVLNELARGRLSGPVSRVVYLNSDDALKAAKFANHYPQDPNREENHGWMDKYGWDWYNGYLLDKDNKLMPFTLHVARTSNGRYILYDAFVGTKMATDIDLAETAKNNPAEDFTQTPELQIPTNTQEVEDVAADYEDVKERLDRGFSLAGPNAYKADLGLLEVAQKQELNGIDKDTIWKETGWFRGVDGKWKFEIYDKDFKFLSSFLEIESRTTDKPVPASKMATVYDLADILYAPALFNNYRELMDYRVVISGAMEDSLAGEFISNSNTIRLNRNYFTGFNGKYSAPACQTIMIGTVLHEIQHAIQNIEGFATGSSPKDWNRMRGVEGVTEQYNPKDRAQQSLMYWKKLISPEDYEELYGFVELRRNIFEYTQDGKADLVPAYQLMYYDDYFNDLAKKWGLADLADFVHDAEAYDRLKPRKNKNDSDYELYQNTAGEIEARDVAERHTWSEKKRRSTRPRTPTRSAIFNSINPAGDAHSEGPRYSLVPVEPVQPSSDAWSRTADTDEARAAFPQLWDVTAEESEVRNPTQIKSTVSTYRKIYDLLKKEGFDGTILDASSGLGYGTRAGIDEYGFDVDDIEPYPDSSYEPKYTDYSKLRNTYDAIISNAVLNVIPQDQRDALVVKMGELLNPGGRMFINVRGNDVDTLANTKGNIKLGDREWIVTSTGSYQKGFTKPELKAYLEDALGPGYTVETTNKFGGVAAIVTKNDSGIRYSLLQEKVRINPIDAYNTRNMTDEQKLEYYTDEIESTQYWMNERKRKGQYSKSRDTEDAKRLAQLKRVREKILYRIAGERYIDAVNSGDFATAENLFNTYVLNNSRDTVTPFLYTSKYSDDYENTSEVAHGVKLKDGKYLNLAADEMVEKVPKNAVLIPMPGRHGYADDTLALAETIAKKYNASHAEQIDVLDILKGKDRPSQYETKIAEGRSLTPEELGFYLDGKIPIGRIPVFIDNVVASGTTATAAQKTAGRGITLAYAYGDKTRPEWNEVAQTRGLKLAEPITYDDNGNVIPLSERFNPDNSDIRFSLANPVDVFGDEVSVETADLTDAVPSELSEDLVYANGNAYYRTPDGQTVVINNVTEDSPEAEYFNLLENYDNANSSNTTAEKPYIIPQATRNEPDGYNLREQDASLRRGSEEVPAEYQEGTLRRAGSSAERNEARGSQSAEEESVRYSIVEPDHYSSTGRPVYRNRKGDYNARITDNDVEVTTADVYPIGSIEHDLIKAWNNGDWAKFENNINKLVEETDEATMQENIELLRQVTAIDEVLSENEKKALNKRLSDLLKKYGEMQRSKGAKKRNSKYVLAAKTDDAHKIMRNLETHGQNTEEGDEILTDQITKLALQDERMSYVPQSNAESIEKAKQLFASEGSFENAAAYIDGLVKSGKRITPEDVALGEMLIMDAGEIRDLNAFSELVANFAILSHEYGQVLQAFQLLRKLTPGGQLLYMQKVVDRLNQQYQSRIENPRDPMKKIEISQTDIDAIKNCHTRKELDQAIENLKQNIANQIPATAMDKWNSWRYLAMLGNPRTHLRNIFGNMAFAPAVFLKDAYARGFEKKYIADGARNRIGGAKLDKNNPYMQLALDDFQAMRKIVSGEAGGNKYTDANEIQQLRRIFDSEFMNQLARFNGEKLGEEDVWFMEKYYTRAWAEFMQARGLTVDEVKALGDSPETRKLLQEARIWATTEAQRNTYHDANALASTLNRLKRQNGVSFVLLEGLVPFTKTPANILKRAIEYSPYGIISGMIQLKRDLAAGRSANQAVDRLAAGWSGTTIIALGILLRALGALRGAGEDDPDEEKFEKLQGHQQWSIEIPWLNGKRASYTIDWMAPTALPLFIGASAYDLFDSARDKGLGAWNAWEFAELMTRLVDPMLSLSMLDGIENTISSVANAQGASKLSTLMTSMFLSYAAQGVPTIAGQIARSFDPSRRSTYIDKNSTTPASLQRFWQSSVQSKIPGYEAEKMAYVDEWGRTDSKMTAGEWFWGAFENFVSPGYGNVIKTTAVDEELNRLYEATGDKGVLPDAAAKYFNEVIDGLSQRKELTADEYEKLQMTRGQTAFSVISDLIASPEYADLSDADKAKLVGNAYTYADQMAKNTISEYYAEDKWVDLAKRVGAVDYLLIKTDYDENRSNEKLFSWLVTNPNLNDHQIAELIANKYNAPAEVKSASTFGYVYQINDADEDAINEIIRDLVDERLGELKRSDEYINADNAERGALMADLWTQAKEDAATIYGATLDSGGRAMTIGKASSVGSEAFHMVLDKPGTVADQSDWLGKKYRADHSLKNPLHPGYNLDLTTGQERKLEQTFRAAWDVEYAKLLQSDEFKNAPNRTYQDNMIADRYNAAAASVEDSFATELYRSNEAAESFAKKPTGYTWGEAYTIASEHFSDTTEAAHWIAQKYSTGSTISHPDRPGYDMILTGAQQVEIQEQFDAAFTPAYNALLKSPEFKALSPESQENRINDLQKKVTAEVENSYGKMLIATGREFDQELNLNSSYDKIYTMLATEQMTDASRKAIMKDKYDGGTVTNPAAKEYRKERYDMYIDQLWSKYIKTGAATEYEKLHKAAGDASGKDMKKKFGNVSKIGDVADLEYDIVVPEYDYTPQTYGTTYTSEGTTPYVIPAANYTDEQKNIMSKYGLVPKK